MLFDEEEKNNPTDTDHVNPIVATNFIPQEKKEVAKAKAKTLKEQYDTLLKSAKSSGRIKPQTRHYQQILADHEMILKQAGPVSDILRE